MALWGNLDAANNAPKYKGVLAGPSYAATYEHVGPASKVTFPSGAGYVNTDVLVVTVGTPGTTYANGVLALTTNATGYIQSMAKITPGSFSVGASNAQFAITNSTFGTATGNSTTTGFVVTFDSRLSGAEMYANTQVGAFVPGQIDGVYGVSTDEIGNFTVSPGISPGWILEKRGTGPVTAVTVSGGAGFANGDTITLSNGQSNGVVTLTTNATGNLVSGAVTTPGSGWFTNTHVVAGFNREKHASNVNYTGTATGYSNTDVVTVSNAIVNAVATVSTNSTGGALTFTFTNAGIFANTTSNTQVVIKVANSTGGNSAGSGATFASANLSPSTGGTVTVTTTGGRSNRKQYEVLAVVHKMANNTNSPGGGSNLA
jgi:hypothetical protein